MHAKANIQSSFPLYSRPLHRKPNHKSSIVNWWCLYKSTLVYACMHCTYMYVGAVLFPWSGLLVTDAHREPIARNKAEDVQTCKDYSWSCIMNFSLYNVYLQYSVMAYQCNSCLYSILEDMATCHHSPRSMGYAQFNLVFVSLWQRIGFAVMDERVVAVAPRKGLGSDPQM